MRFHALAIVVSFGLIFCLATGCGDDDPTEPEISTPAPVSTLLDAWAFGCGGTQDEWVGGIANDASGNVVVVGYFKSSATFGGNTLNSAGDYDVFVAKVDEEGTLLWAISAGGTEWDSGNGVAIDAAGNVFVAGNFGLSASFEGTNLTSVGDDDTFLAKYDAAGALLWARSDGGTLYDWAKGVAVDGSGNVYVTGIFQGSADFGATTLNSAGDQDVFVAKYDADGALLWAISDGGMGVDRGARLVVDGSGNVYVTGSFYGVTNIGGTELTSVGLSDSFVAKYSADGNALWGRSAGGINHDYGADIALSGSENVVVTGAFRENAHFGATTISSSGDRDAFVAKYSPDGAVLWVHAAGGSATDAPGGITTDSKGNAVITGHFQDTAGFSGTTLTSAGVSDVFVAKYGSAGDLLWADSAGDIGFDLGCAVVVNPTGNVVVAGQFETASATFGDETLTSAGARDVFIVMMGRKGF